MLLTIIAKVVNEDNFMDEFLRTAIQYTGKSKEKTNMQINDLELLKRNIRIGKYKLAKGKTFIFIRYCQKYYSLRPITYSLLIKLLLITYGPITFSSMTQVKS